jgi:hypothetical protein
VRSRSNRFPTLSHAGLVPPAKAKSGRLAAAVRSRPLRQESPKSNPEATLGCGIADLRKGSGILAQSNIYSPKALLRDLDPPRPVVVEFGLLSTCCQAAKALRNTGFGHPFFH